MKLFLESSTIIIFEDELITQESLTFLAFPRSFRFFAGTSAMEFVSVILKYTEHARKVFIFSKGVAPSRPKQAAYRTGHLIELPFSQF